MSDRIELRVSAELLKRLDDARGEVPRGTFIKRALELALGGSSGGQSRGDDPRVVGSTPARPTPTRAPDEPVANVLGSSVRKVPSLRDPVVDTPSGPKPMSEVPLPKFAPRRT